MARNSKLFIAAGGVLLGILALTVAAYVPGLPGTFILDDQSNLSPMSAHGAVDDIRSFRSFVFGNHSGRTGRPVSMASFLIDDNSWPSDADTFKRTNIKLHLLCTLLVAWLGWLVAQRLGLSEKRALALTVTISALWALHPLHATTVLYVVQRMTQLSAFFVLLGIISFLKLEQTGYRKLRDLITYTACFGLAAALGILSKENAIVLPLLVLIAASCLPYRPTHTNERRNRNTWLATFCGLPIATFLGWCVANWHSIMSGYQRRDFDLYERLLTQARVLGDYIEQILLHRVRGTGLTHDDIVVSTSLFEPLTTLMAIAVMALLIAFAFLVRRTIPVATFGILWFFGAHLIESSFIPLELYFEHRNYLPMVGLLLAFVGILVWLIDRTASAVRLSLATVPVVIVALHATMLLQTTQIFGNPHLFIQVWEVEHPKSARAKRMLAEYFEQRDEPKVGVKLYQEGLDIHPRDLSMMAGAIGMACRMDWPLPYSVGEFIERAKRSRITDGLLPIMERITLDIVANRCKRLDRTDMHRMLNASHEVSGLSYDPRTAAKLHYLQADLYAEERRLDPAIRHLEAAYRFQPSVDIAIRQVVLLSSAGLYETALKRLELAYAAHKRRSLLLPSRLPELNTIQRYLRARVKQSVESS